MIFFKKLVNKFCFNYIKFIKNKWNNETNLINFIYILSIISIVLTSQSFRYSNAVETEQFNIRDFSISNERFVTQLNLFWITEPLLSQGIIGVSSPKPFQDVYRSYLIATYFNGDIEKEIRTVNNQEDLKTKIKIEELKKWSNTIETGKKQVLKYQKILNILFFINSMVQILLAVCAFKLGQSSLKK
jgi:hypothetical protein